MYIFVVMFEIFMLCVSSDISHHVYYILYYTMLGFLALLEFEINSLSLSMKQYLIVFQHDALRSLFAHCEVDAM